MDPNSKNVLLGASGASGYPGYDTNKTGKYLIVPYYHSTIGYRLLFVDSDTANVDRVISYTTIHSKIYRFGTNILTTSDGQSYSLRSILTGQVIASGDFGTNGYIKDELKFGSDKLLMLGWDTSGSSTATAYTFTVNNSGVTQITSATSTSMGTYNSTYGMISNPVLGGQAYIDSTTGILSSMATIGTKAPYDNLSSADAARGSMSVASDGTSISFGGSVLDSSNYSRPVAGTGSNGFCLVSGMDGSDVRIFSGASHGSYTGLISLSAPPINNFSPAPLLSTTAWVTIKTDYTNYYFTYVDTGGTTNLFTLPNGSSGAMVQSIPGGAAVVYENGTSMFLRKYLISGGLQSAVAINKLPGPVTAGCVNSGFMHKKIINY
jgi:hypothetical protein